MGSTPAARLCAAGYASGRLKPRGSALKPARVALLLTTLALASCALPARERGPFEGKVVAADTGAPIAGAVVLAVWKRIASVLGGTEFYDVRVAVTDAQGRFEIPRLPMPWRLGVQPPTFRWYAPGYTAVNVVLDRSPDRRARVPTLIEMRELKYFDMEALRRGLPLRDYEGLPFGLPEETLQMLRTVVNERRQALGLPPLGATYTWSSPYELPEERRAPEAGPPQVVPLPPPNFSR